MNQFIEKSQLYILCVKAKRDPLSVVTARESFTNDEIETLLRNHNVTLTLDQSVKRLKENAVFSIKGNVPTLEEFSKFYEEFEEAVLSLGVQFKPENKVVREIFVSKIKPERFQEVVKHETATRDQFPTSQRTRQCLLKRIIFFWTLKTPRLRLVGITKQLYRWLPVRPKKMLYKPKINENILGRNQKRISL